MAKVTTNYGDYLAELFPNKSGELAVGKNHFYNITMQVTEDCNLRCTYCYQHDKTPKAMSFETGKKFIDLILASDERTDKLIRSRECSGVALEFIGGEPLLEIDLISSLTNYFIDKMIELDHPWLTRYMISICTNGVLYFDEKFQTYLKKHAGHVSLSITVDGNKKVHDMCRLDANGNGSYDRAMAAVEHYNKHYFGRSGTKVTISPDNIIYVGEAIIDFINSGEPEINANCVYENVWKPEHATELYKQLKQVADYLLDNNLYAEHYVSILDWGAGEKYPSENTWCGGSGLMMAVAPDGNIYPCLRYAPSSVGQTTKPIKLGDVDHGLIYNDEQQNILDTFKCVTRCSQCEKTEHCKDCPIAMGCGDCAAYSYEIYGELGRRTTFHCEMHKARVLAQVYYKNKRALKSNEYQGLKMNCPKDWAIPIIGEEEYQMLCDLANEVN